MIRGENVELAHALCDGYSFLCRLEADQAELQPEEVQTNVRVVCRNSLSKLSHLDLDSKEDNLLWHAKNEALPKLVEVLEKAHPDGMLPSGYSITNLITLAKDALHPFCNLVKGHTR